MDGLGDCVPGKGLFGPDGRGAGAGQPLSNTAAASAVMSPAASLVSERCS